MQNKITPTDQPKTSFDQKSQQNGLQHQEQIFAYNDAYSSCQEIIVKHLIKEVDFKSQKMFLLKIIGIFIIWSLIFFLLFQLLGLCITQKNKPFSSILTILSFIVLILMMKIGIRHKNRNIEKSCLIFLTLLIFYTILYFSFIWSLELPKDNNELTVDAIIGTIVLITMGLNFLVNIIVMLYLLLERERIRLLYVIAIEIALFSFLCLFYTPTVIYIPFGLPYTYCLIKTFQQILNGKFNLRQNEVISGVIATYLGLFNICNDQYRDL